MGLKEKFVKDARATAKKITDEVIPNSHIGNHTIESLSQEVFSLRNTKPMFRDAKWKKQFLKVDASIRDKISHGQNQYQSLLIEMTQIQDMR
jgi:hypothetical protein